jgi:magnesium chelatase family protein
MLAKVLSGTTIGLDGVLIEVEVDVAGRGFPSFNIVGLPNKAIEEAKDRVRTAILNTGFEMPDSRLTVNLAPADIPKEGSAYDLPIAVGILAASGMIQRTALPSSLFIGEVSLEGKLPVKKEPYTSFIGAKLFISFIKMVVLTTFVKSMPASFKIAETVLIISSGPHK